MHYLGLVDLKSIFDRFFQRRRKARDGFGATGDLSAWASGCDDVRNSGFPLVPDDHHLTHVGKTAQGNGYWIAGQLAVEGDDVRYFIAAYVFDKLGNLIFCEVVDQGKGGDFSQESTRENIQMLERKIDAKGAAAILVKPFSTSFYGHTFGLIIRDHDEGEDPHEDVLIDAMPGHTLMFYGPWNLCNYDS